MADIKRIKGELLQLFNKKTVAPETVARDDGLDSALRLYFARATFMRKEMILEAIIHGLHINGADRPVSKHEIQHFLDHHDHH